MNLALFSNARYRISFITTMKKSVGVFKYQRVFNRNNTGTRTGMLGCFFLMGNRTVFWETVNKIVAQF